MWQGTGLNEGSDILRTQVSSQSRCQRIQRALSPITASQSEQAAPISAPARCRQTQCHYGGLTLLDSFISILRYFMTGTVPKQYKVVFLDPPLSELIHAILPEECSIRCKDVNETLIEALFKPSWIFWGLQKASLWIPHLLSSPFYLFFFSFWLPLDLATYLVIIL